MALVSGHMAEGAIEEWKMVRICVWLKVNLRVCRWKEKLPALLCSGFWSESKAVHINISSNNECLLRWG